jgi:hypothetical protein
MNENEAKLCIPKPKISWNSSPNNQEPPSHNIPQSPHQPQNINLSLNNVNFLKKQESLTVNTRKISCPLKNADCVQQFTSNIHKKSNESQGNNSSPTLITPKGQQSLNAGNNAQGIPSFGECYQNLAVPNIQFNQKHPNGPYSLYIEPRSAQNISIPSHGTNPIVLICIPPMGDASRPIVTSTEKGVEIGTGTTQIQFSGSNVVLNPGHGPMCG